MVQGVTCDNAHLVATSSSTMGPTSAIEINGGTEGLFYTSVATTVASTMTVCYASAESGGDSADDYAKLVTPFIFRPGPQYHPKRIIQGSAPVPRFPAITGSRTNDRVVWVRPEYPGGCQITVDIDGRASSSTYSETYSITSNADPTALAAFNSDLTAGVYYMCYKTLSGEYTQVHDGNLTVLSNPVMFPTVGVAASPTPIKLTGSLVGLPSNGDFIHLTQKTDCSDAHTDTVTSTTNLGKTAMSTFQGAASEHFDASYGGYVDRLGFNMPTSMSEPSLIGNILLFKVCYAPSDTQGDEAGDWNQISSFTMRSTVSYSPTRIVYGTYQRFVIFGAGLGDMIVWAYPTCLKAIQSTDATRETPQTDMTSNAHITGSPHTYTLVKHLYSGAGGSLFQACYKPGNGTWTRLYGKDLTSIQRPKFHPEMGLASVVTPITLSSSTITTGDIVVISTHSGCVGASTQNTTTPTMLRKTHIYIDSHTGSPMVLTHVNMTQGGTGVSPQELYICVATSESVGEDDYDYTPTSYSLSSSYKFLHFTPPTVSPLRAAAHSIQQISLTGTPRDNDKVLYTQDANCTNAATGVESLIRTARHSLGGAGNNAFSLNNQTAGTYTLCYMLNGGIWQKVPAGELTLVSPRYSIDVMLTHTPTKLILTNGATAGDFIVQQNTPCNSGVKAHAVTDGPFSAGKRAAVSSLSGVVSVSTGGSLTTMTAHENPPGTPLMMYTCYASKESMGDTEDDYIDLTSQTYPPQAS